MCQLSSVCLWSVCDVACVGCACVWRWCVYGVCVSIPVRLVFACGCCVYCVGVSGVFVLRVCKRKDMHGHAQKKAIDRCRLSLLFPELAS